jgi:hypothetical protein
LLVPRLFYAHAGLLSIALSAMISSIGEKCGGLQNQMV